VRSILKSALAVTVFPFTIIIAGKETSFVIPFMVKSAVTLKFSAVLLPLIASTFLIVITDLHVH
jgi:hypothetical protein